MPTHTHTRTRRLLVAQPPSRGTRRPAIPFKYSKFNHNQPATYSWFTWSMGAGLYNISELNIHYSLYVPYASKDELILTSGHSQLRQ